MVTNRRSRFMQESLSSMKNQSYPHVELIVVDDGSPEPGALQDVLGQDVRYLRQPPSGVSVGRNRGVALARGELVGFFDDDDRYPSDWVSSHVVRHVQEPETVLTYTGMRLIDEHGEIMAIDPQRQGDIHDTYRRTVGILAGSMIVKREAFWAAGGFNPLIRFAEDLDLVLRLAHVGAFRYVDGVLRDYRTHEDNVTRRHHDLAGSIRTVIEFHSHLMEIAGRLDLVEDLRVSNEANDRYAGWRALRASRDHLRSGRPGGAASELAWLAAFAPKAPITAIRKRIRTARARQVDETARK
ncbi:glycosyltransferase [Ornithinimicrobium kibberense]|nr:glycosyltransferase [Ornithinimicrobium kibberense]